MRIVTLFSSGVFLAFLVMTGSPFAMSQGPIQTYPQTSWATVSIPKSQVTVGTSTFTINFSTTTIIGSSITNWISAFQFGNFYTSPGAHAPNATSTATFLKGMATNSISFSGDPLENNSIDARYEVEYLGAGGTVKDWKQSSVANPGSERGTGGFMNAIGLDDGVLVSFAVLTATLRSVNDPDDETNVTNYFPLDASQVPSVSFLAGSEDLVISNAGYFMTNDIVEIGTSFAAPGQAGSPFQSLPALEGMTVGANQALNNIVLPDQIVGDFDLSGGVDGSDFLAWQRGESPNPLSPSDLADWESSYGNNAPLVGAASSIAVPEPATAVLLLFGMANMFIRQRNGESKFDRS